MESCKVENNCKCKMIKKLILICSAFVMGLVGLICFSIFAADPLFAGISGISAVAAGLIIWSVILLVVSAYFGVKMFLCCKKHKQEQAPVVEEKPAEEVAQ